MAQVIDPAELREALYSATTVEPRKPKVMDVANWGDRTLSELGAATLKPDRRKSVRILKRQILKFLEAMNESDTVADLREALEELGDQDE